MAARCYAQRKAGRWVTDRQKDIEEQEGKVLEINRKTAEFQRLKDNKQRIQAEHDSLQLTIQKLDVSTVAGPDSVTILQKASPAGLSRPALSKKLVTGGLIGLGYMPLLTLWRIFRGRPVALRSNHTSTVDVASRLGYKPIGRGKYRLVENGQRPDQIQSNEPDRVDWGEAEGDEDEPVTG